MKRSSRIFGGLCILLLDVGFSVAGQEFVSTPSGLQYSITEHGSGDPPNPNDIVMFRYILKRADGTVASQSRDDEAPAAYFGGAHSGWFAGMREGLSLLRVGDRATFVIPAHLAYGDKGAPQGNIPPNSSVTVDVQVVAFKRKRLSDVLKDAIDAKGLKAGRRLYSRLKSTNFPDVYEGETGLRYLGFHYLYKKNAVEEAITVSEWCVELYPRSPKARIALAEAYLLSGDRELALVHYKKAEELDVDRSLRIGAIIADLESDPSRPRESEILQKFIAGAKTGMIASGQLQEAQVKLDFIRMRLTRYISQAPSDEAAIAADLTRQFFELAEVNEPETLENICRTLLSSANAEVRELAREKLSAIEKH